MTVKSYREKLIIRLCCLLLLLCMIPVRANEQDIIYLQADKIDYDYKKGVIHYTGHVRGRQNASELTADDLIVYYNAQHKIERIEAKGNLACYKTLCHENKDTLIARANTIYYYPIAEKVVLRENAKVDYNQSVFLGTYLVYDINKQVITSHPQSNSPAKIILEPLKNLIKK